MFSSPGRGIILIILLGGVEKVDFYRKAHKEGAKCTKLNTFNTILCVLSENP
jgi:hypothetical protein